MRRQTARRKVKKRKAASKNSRVKFILFLGIMGLAVFLGFLTARFAVGPALGIDADESPARIAEAEEDAPQEGEENTKTSGPAAEKEETEAAPKEGFALQFGVFSAKEGAAVLSASLEEQGIRTVTVQENGMYKVISPAVKSKDEALEQLKQMQNKEIEDVFIASF